jgi:hypothetical protein
MAEWSEYHVAAICSIKLNCVLVVRFWLNGRLGGALKWKGEDHRLGRSRSGVWKVGIFKVIAPTCVG